MTGTYRRIHDWHIQKDARLAHIGSMIGIQRTNSHIQKILVNCCIKNWQSAMFWQNPPCTADGGSLQFVLTVHERKCLASVLLILYNLCIFYYCNLLLLTCVCIYSYIAQLITNCNSNNKLDAVYRFSLLYLLFTEIWKGTWWSQICALLSCLIW